VTSLGDGPCVVQGGELRCGEGGWEVHERPYRWVVHAAAGTLPTVRKLVANSDTGYALTEDGRLFGWGNNRDRSQGRGFVSADEYPQATRIEGIEGVVDIGQNSALTKEGRVLVWGFNFDATFPLEQEHIYRPTALGGLCDAKALTGHYQTCVLRSGGTVLCWGGRGYDGDRWQDLVYEAKLPPVARLINGGETTCAITTQGELHCWSGFLANGVQIGTPELVPTAFPQSTAQCPAQVPAAIEAYPGVAYDRVESYSHDGRCASVLNGPCGSLKRGKDLSPQQIDAILALVNDPASYSKMSIHCFTPRHELVFRDAQGVAVASMQICFECHGIDFMPAVPAREVTGGRDPVGKVMRHLRSLCRALDLDRCYDR
jgi:hypothetical protein